MATNWKYYIPHNELFSATLTATTGTSSTLANIQNVRRYSRMDVDTVGTYVSGSDEFMFRIDFGSGVTKTCNFVALLNHNLVTETGKLRVYTDNADNASLTDPQFMLNEEDVVAGDDPIWVEAADNERTKRYFWVLFDSIAATAYCGICLLGEVLNPTPDPNWESPIEIDIESGRIINTTPAGVQWITRTSEKANGFAVRYEVITTAQKDEIADALFAYPDNPFVFTNDGGTTYYYGRVFGNPVLTPVQAGLWNLEFTIQEAVA